MDETYRSSTIPGQTTKYGIGIMEFADKFGFTYAEVFNAHRKANNAATGENKPLIGPSVLDEVKDTTIKRLIFNGYNNKTQSIRGAMTHDGTVGQRVRQGRSFSPSGGNYNREEKAFIDTVRVLEGTSDENGYDTWFGGRNDMKMTDMTIQEVHDEQSRRMAAGETTYGDISSAAVGAGQFMEPLNQVREMYESQGKDFDPTKVLFTKELQDELILDLAKRKRGVDVSKVLTESDIENLGGEWASFTPKLGQTDRTAGQSLNTYYDRLNN